VSERCGSLHILAGDFAAWCTREPEHDGLHQHDRIVWAQGDALPPGVYWVPFGPRLPKGWKPLGYINEGSA
jgi:hypothetical protein